jgi:SAM-dependent methyltransferase
MKELLRKTYWVLNTQLGWDPRRLVRSVKNIPQFTADWLQFRKHYKGKLRFFPCLNDRHEQGGSAHSEYFWQDLYVARKIFTANPQKHVDVGSRVDGFVAHIAAFRNIEVLDIRPITVAIPGVTFTQTDLMKPAQIPSAYCDSLSCLHALEHFGLGRYGDPINPEGHRDGLSNMIEILRPGGTLYLSVPVGIERVEFNAHRIFAPRALVDLAAGMGMALQEFAWMEPGQPLIQSPNPQQDLSSLGKRPYALGIFTFIKQ